jgi:flagellar assembly protein FliH
MSTESFSPVLFPRLDGREGGAEHARARMRGYADGHAEGFRAGAEEAAAAHRAAEEERAARDAAAARDVDAAIAALHAAARSLAVRERELTAAAEEQVLRCAVELAEQIVVGELSDSGAAAAAAARRALASAEPAEIREVRLHPDDLGTIQATGAELAGFALIADDDLDRGDAIAILEHGHIDARIARAFERARAALAEAGA